MLSRLSWRAVYTVRRRLYFSGENESVPCYDNRSYWFSTWLGLSSDLLVVETLPANRLTGRTWSMNALFLQPFCSRVININRGYCNLFLSCKQTDRADFIATSFELSSGAQGMVVSTPALDWHLIVSTRHWRCTAVLTTSFTITGISYWIHLHSMAYSDAASPRHLSYFQKHRAEYADPAHWLDSGRMNRVMTFNAEPSLTKTI